MVAGDETTVLPPSAGEQDSRVRARARHELDPADVAVHKDGTFTTVSAAYIEYIELVPRFYTREQLFEFEVSVHPVRPLTADDLR